MKGVSMHYVMWFTVLTNLLHSLSHAICLPVKNGMMVVLMMMMTYEASRAVFHNQGEFPPGGNIMIPGGKFDLKEI